MNKRIIFIVAGRFGKSLTLSKIMPIQATGLFDKIFVFRELEGYAFPNVEYITLKSIQRLRPSFLKKIVRTLVEPVQLIYYAFKTRPGIINSYQIVPKAYYTVLAAKLSGALSIVSSVGGIPEIKTYFRFRNFSEYINIMTLNLSDIVTTKGKTVTNYIIGKGVVPGKISTFNGAINTEVFRDIDQVRDIDILFLGSLIEVKGPDRFVKIVSSLVKVFPDLKAVIIGEGEMKEQLEETVRILGLGANLKFMGYSEHPEHFFQRSKILLMPSRSEGLATAMVEAMACGCVPVVSDVGCMAEAAFHGKNSLLVKDYLDIDGYANLIKELFDNESDWQELSKNASNLARTTYSVENQALIFTQILKRSKYLSEP